MAHKTLIGGTAYEISGGKTLVDGTAYSIDKGKTLVGGTAYEVGFAEMATVKIQRSSYDYNNSYVTIDGQNYTGANNTTEITVPIGTVIHCCCIANTKKDEDGDITLNGVSVESNDTFGMTTYYEYEHTVNGNVTISFSYMQNSYSEIHITET